MANKTTQQKIRQGYKETRFRLIPDDWQIKKLSEVSEVLLSNVDKKTSDNETPVRLCNYTDVYGNEYIQNDMPFMEVTATGNEIAKFSLKRGDVIITKDSEEREDIAVPAYVMEDLENVLCGYHLAVIRPNAKVIDGLYLAKILSLHEINYHFVRQANGVTRFGIGISSIKNACIYLPPLREQKRISSLLMTWNQAIDNTEKLILAKRKLKKGLMQQLLTGKRRFKGFIKEPWQDYHLGELFKERVETGREDLPLLAITSDRGVINREEIEKKDSSSEDKSKYKRIVPGDIGYNTMRMWQGVSAISALEGIVSPAYTICIPQKSRIYGLFAAYLFKYPPIVNLFYRYSQGLVSDTLSLKLPLFSQIKVTIPQLAEQKQIASVLADCDKEIHSVEQKLELLKQQKRGLMQKLLTGQIRIKGFGSDTEKHHA